MSTRNEGAGGFSEPAAHDPTDTTDLDQHRFETRPSAPNGSVQQPAAPAQPGGAGGLAGLASFAGMGAYTPTTQPQSDTPAPAEPDLNGAPNYAQPEPAPAAFPDREPAGNAFSQFDSFQREEPRYEPPQYEDPFAAEPQPQFEQSRYEEPRYEEPQPRFDDSRFEEPRFEEPRYEEPQSRFEAAQPREPQYDDGGFAARVAAQTQRAEPRFEETGFDASRFEPSPHGAPAFDDPDPAGSRLDQPSFDEHRFDAAPAAEPHYEPSPGYQAMLGADEPQQPEPTFGADAGFDAGYEDETDYRQTADLAGAAQDPLPRSFTAAEPAYADEQPDYAAEYAPDMPAYGQQEPATDFAAFPATPAGEPSFGAPEPELPGNAAVDANTGLQQYEARYDRHPEIPLGGYDNQADASEDAGKQPYFHETEQGDADFLGEDAPAKGGKSRKFLMVACGLVGALALGGALAFAYKTSGSFLTGSDTPPIIEADSRPVKVAPETPGGKEFPHKNKLIYDRLSGEDRPETEKLVSRQEDVVDEVQRALTATQPSNPGAVAPTGDDAQRNRGFTPPKEKAAAPAATPNGGPRRVKTLVVRPDGTIVRQAQPAAPQPAAPQTAQPEAPAPAARPEPAPAQPRVAAAPVTRAEPEPAPAPAAAPENTGDATPPPTRKPRPAAVASARPTAQQPAAAPSAGGGQYVVQVGARRSQTAALAGFADLQQKYPSILSGYRPIIQKADLGNKGTWYRLRIGPLETKTAAADLCRKLKSAGMRSCLVNTK